MTKSGFALLLFSYPLSICLFCMRVSVCRCAHNIIYTHFFIIRDLKRHFKSFILFVSVVCVCMLLCVCKSNQQAIGHNITGDNDISCALMKWHHIHVQFKRLAIAFCHLYSLLLLFLFFEMLVSKKFHFHWIQQENYSFIHSFISSNFFISFFYKDSFSLPCNSSSQFLLCGSQTNWNDEKCMYINFKRVVSVCVFSFSIFT